LLAGVLGAGCRSLDAPSSGVLEIVVVPFALAPGSPVPPVDVARAIRTALAREPAFDVALAAHPAPDPAAVADVRFEEWRARGVDLVVVGLVGRVHDGGHEVEFHLLDVDSEASVLAYMVPSAPDDLAATARAIAAMIEGRLAGAAG